MRTPNPSTRLQPQKFEKMVAVSVPSLGRSEGWWWGADNITVKRIKQLKSNAQKCIRHQGIT